MYPFYLSICRYLLGSTRTAFDTLSCLILCLVLHLIPLFTRLPAFICNSNLYYLLSTVTLHDFSCQTVHLQAIARLAGLLELNRLVSRHPSSGYRNLQDHLPRRITFGATQSSVDLFFFNLYGNKLALACGINRCQVLITFNHHIENNLFKKGFHTVFSKGLIYQFTDFSLLSVLRAHLPGLKLARLASLEKIRLDWNSNQPRTRVPFPFASWKLTRSFFFFLFPYSLRPSPTSYESETNFYWAQGIREKREFLESRTQSNF
ncbi:hypothetical protein F5B22DRAFT_463258 [Xylaria bambusicola]|uniref:uncharacterized protein n=1 Tax=Xylaria bambusicola TaxID=326684 RepID=UPI0020075D6B|nr:uncharacterized protein F5B22DRAFT_463258 [Xylaria bambusicola]KAI0522186.1 hypothetical protein F5B22DRAFT_463258 [Xylaria bambusicola]